MAEKIKYKELIDSNGWSYLHNNSTLINGNEWSQSKTEDLTKQYDILVDCKYKSTSLNLQNEAYVKVTISYKNNKNLVLILPFVNTIMSDKLTYKIVQPQGSSDYVIDWWTIKIYNSSSKELIIDKISMRIDLDSSPGETAPSDSNVSTISDIASATPPYKPLPRLLGNVYYISFLPAMYSSDMKETLYSTDLAEHFEETSSGLAISSFTRKYSWNVDSYKFDEEIREVVNIELNTGCCYETNCEDAYNAIVNKNYPCIYTNNYIHARIDNTPYDYWYTLPTDVNNYKYCAICYYSKGVYQDGIVIICGDNITQSPLNERSVWYCKINTTGNNSRIWEYDNGNFVDKGDIQYKGGILDTNYHTFYTKQLEVKEILRMANVEAILIN